MIKQTLPMTKRVCVEEGVILRKKKLDKPWVSRALDKPPIKTIFQMLVTRNIPGL